MRRRITPVLAGALGALLVWAPGATAQVIRGQLLDDETGRPVEGGTMRLMLGDRPVDRVLTDSAGTFLLQGPDEGVYSVTAERIGYQQTRSALMGLAVGDTLTVEFRLLTEAILLEPMLVVATSRAGQAQFNRRMAAGAGQFLTREMLDTLDVWHPAVAFRQVEDFHLGWRWGVFESGERGMMPDVRSFRGSGCLAYVVDGMAAGPRTRFERGRNPWSLPPLSGLLESEIMGMEFYRYAGEVPDELRNLVNQATRFTSGSGGLCGLVVIWTRIRWN